jgi:hypothetical protein
MSEIAKAAGKGDIRHRGAWGRRMGQHLACMAHPHLLHESHRRIAAPLLEGVPNAPGARIGRQGQGFDGNRLVPMRLDIVLGAAHLPWSAAPVRRRKQIAKVAGIGFENVSSNACSISRSAPRGKTALWVSISPIRNQTRRRQRPFSGRRKSRSGSKTILAWGISPIRLASLRSGL